MSAGKYPNSGTLGKNARMRKGKNDPSYSGKCEVAGVEYWISAWVKEGNDGSKFFSLSFNPKDAPKQQAAPAAPEAAPEEDSEIPF